MNLKRNRFYIVLLLSCLAGYVWLYISIKTNNNHQIGVCIFKHVTNIPCPSCGSTRSILSLIHGNIKEAIYWNPIGLLIVLIMVASPFWMVFDFITHKETLLSFYEKIESTLNQKRIAIPAILLIVTNWIWNIYKGL